MHIRDARHSDRLRAPEEWPAGRVAKLHGRLSQARTTDFQSEGLNIPR